MSTLSKQRGGAHSFEGWIVRPVYLVNVFTCLAQRVVATPEDDLTTLRIRPPYRTDLDRERRRDVAGLLRSLRAIGLTRQHVRSLALVLIYAPESYGGVKRSEARELVVNRLREYLYSGRVIG